jgi:hypothetical protein
MPQYMLLLYTPTDHRPPADDPGVDFSRWIAYGESLRDAGLLVGSNRLHETEMATTVRVRGGETLVTDGPFAETNEYLAGYFLLECPNLDAALEAAGRVPHIHYGTVEVRPVMDGAPNVDPNGKAAAQA